MKAITLYVVLVFAFSSVFYALIIASGHVLGGNARYATGLEWCPAAAALLTCTLLRVDIGTIGWRWRPWRWQILAYATPLLFCLIGYVAVWATGLGGFPNGKTVDSLKAALGIPLNYHDLHDPFFAPADLAKINKAVFAALKPGGRYVIIDHAAAAGSGLRDTNTLHRIDEASVQSEVEAAGFRFNGESDLLYNAGDPRTANVKDPTIRGKTNQFILEFRKPKR